METGHANVILLASKDGLETFQIPELTKKVILKMEFFNE
jgi:hypothetical protein